MSLQKTWHLITCMVAILDLTGVPGNAENTSSGSLVLSYFSPDGEEGYPGNLFITIRFELTDKNELSYTYSAITDRLPG